MNRHIQIVSGLTNDMSTNTETHISDDSLAATVHGHSSSQDVYPFARVLRLRVLQIVCGISGLVMGAVAVIEERNITNIGMAIPAGCVTVLAAGASIHTSKGFSGHRSSALNNSSSAFFRFLRPSATVAVPITALWVVSCSLHVILMVQVTRTFVSKPSINIVILAVIELIFTMTILISMLLIIFTNCVYDPD